MRTRRNLGDMSSDSWEIQMRLYGSEDYLESQDPEEDDWDFDEEEDDMYNPDEDEDDLDWDI